MSPRRAGDTPWLTAAVLDILRMLSERGPTTVREVHEALREEEGASCTTSLKLLQIMRAKGLVERDDSQRVHLCRSAINKQRTLKRYLTDLSRRLFKGSTSQMVSHALGSHPSASREELDAIRKLLNKFEAEGI